MKKTEHSEVAIVGGGASGLAAAIELKMKAPSVSVTVIEKNGEPGRKIRATGSGRCNITNRDAEGYTDILEFFTRIGLVTRTYDNGLVYPYSESAADVADLLTARCGELGVRIITDAEVTAVRAGRAAQGAQAEVTGGPGCLDERRSSSETGYTFETEYRRSAKDGRAAEYRVFSDYLILACGGKAGPMFGTTGDGYGLARSLGHSIVTPVPVLTSIECAEWAQGSRPAGISLAGTRTRGTVTLYRRTAEDPDRGPEIFRETGEIQFTKYGISGICVFNMTRHMRYDRSAGETPGVFTVTADLFPDGNIEAFLSDRRELAFPGEKTADVLRTVLKENIAAYVIETAGMALGRPDLDGAATAELTDRDIRAIGDAVHALPFHPERLRGWKEAQASAGGVSMRELDPDTGESLIEPGLFITGELADRDFMCGGFNLSNAWITGLGAAREIISRRNDNRGGARR